MPCSAQRERGREARRVRCAQCQREEEEEKGRCFSAAWRNREESSVVLNTKKQANKEMAKPSTWCSFSNNSTSAKPGLVSGRSRHSMQWPRRADTAAASCCLLPASRAPSAASSFTRDFSTSPRRECFIGCLSASLWVSPPSWLRAA